jgi:hypothetical protein
MLIIIIDAKREAVTSLFAISWQNNWKNASFLQSFANLYVISCRLTVDVVLFQWQLTVLF